MRAGVIENVFKAFRQEQPSKYPIPIFNNWLFDLNTDYFCVSHGIFQTIHVFSFTFNLLHLQLKMEN